MIEVDARSMSDDRLRVAFDGALESA
jgi:hypothetical protein